MTFLAYGDLFSLISRLCVTSDFLPLFPVCRAAAPSYFYSFTKSRVLFFPPLHHGDRRRACKVWSGMATADLPESGLFFVPLWPFMRIYLLRSVILFESF